MGPNRTLPGNQSTPSSSACSTPAKLPPTPNGLVEPTNSQGTSTPDDSDIEGEPGNKKLRTDGPIGLSFDPPSPALDNTCQAARCRSVRSYGKRKLLRTSGVHQLGRKASRLSTVRCHCYPPVVPCAMCGRRYNNVLTVDPETMPLAERVSLLDSSYHPVLSFTHGEFNAMSCETHYFFSGQERMSVYFHLTDVGIEKGMIVIHFAFVTKGIINV